MCVGGGGGGGGGECMSEWVWLVCVCHTYLITLYVTASNWLQFSSGCGLENTTTQYAIQFAS